VRVAGSADSDELSSTRHVVVVLRLVVGADGRIKRGEILDPTQRPPERFVGLAGLGDVLQRWVDEGPGGERTHERDDADPGPG
jgi:hypothetical protein